MHVIRWLHSVSPWSNISQKDVVPILLSNALTLFASKAEEISSSTVQVAWIVIIYNKIIETSHGFESALANYYKHLIKFWSLNWLVMITWSGTKLPFCQACNTVEHVPCRLGRAVWYVLFHWTVWSSFNSIRQNSIIVSKSLVQTNSSPHLSPHENIFNIVFWNALPTIIWLISLHLL